MPSPRDVIAARARVRDAITWLHEQQDPDGDFLLAHLGQLGEDGGRAALSAVVTLAMQGMQEMREAMPGAQLGEIAGELQKSLSRFGEPYASIVFGLTDVIRLQFGGSGETAKLKLDDVWQRWGTDAVLFGATLLMTLYSYVASARGGIGSRAWADAAARDEVWAAEYLAQPLIAAEQALWDAGFTEEDMETIKVRLQAFLIGARSSDSESASFADLATTPHRTDALRTYMQTINDERQKTRR